MVNNEVQVNENNYRVIITSIGKARPSSAAAVAKGLGIKAAELIRCLYQAPSVLVSSVDARIAGELKLLLANIGYEVEVQSCDEVEPQAEDLFEISVYLKDASHLSEAIDKLSHFIGVTEDDASKLLMTPPSTVLGSVSDATVKAFTQHMNGTVEVSTSRVGEDNYHIFLADTPIMVRKRLLHDIQTAGIDLVADQGLLAVDVPREKAQHLWQRHKTNSSLRIVNQNFLRYDLSLVAPNDGIPLRLNQQQTDLLLSICEIPAEVLPDILAAVPVAIFESIAYERMCELMDIFNKHTIHMCADLITFQHLKINICKSPDLSSLNQLLQGFHLTPNTMPLPYLVPQAMPEIQARVLKHTLDKHGHETELVCI